MSLDLPSLHNVRNSLTLSKRIVGLLPGLVNETLRCPVSHPSGRGTPSSSSRPLPGPPLLPRNFSSCRGSKIRTCSGLAISQQLELLVALQPLSVSYPRVRILLTAAASAHLIYQRILCRYPVPVVELLTAFMMQQEGTDRQRGDVSASA